MELSFVEAASRISFNTINATATSIIEGMEQVRQELELSRQRQNYHYDRFTIVMQRFFTEWRDRVNDLDSDIRLLEQEIRELLLWLGEDPSQSKPEDVFTTITSFAASIQKAKQEIEEARIKENANHLKETKLIHLEVPNSVPPRLDDAIRELRSGLRRKRTECIPSLRGKQTQRNPL